MKQVIVGGLPNALSNTADEYNAVQSGTFWVATAAQRHQIVSTAGKFSRLSVELTGVPGTNPYLITLYVNGNPTALATTIAHDATTGIDTDEVDVVAGDYICLKSSRPSGNPDNTPMPRWSIMFEGTTAKESLILGIGNGAPIGDTYNPIVNAIHNQTSATAPPVYQVIPTGGAITNLHIQLHTDPGTAPDAYSFTLYVNGAAVGCPTVTIVADDTTGNDVVNSIAVSAGDYVYLKIVPIDTPSAVVYAAWGMTFVATTDGESIILGQSSDTPTNSQTEYHTLATTYYSYTWVAVEGDRFQGGQAPADDMVLKKFYVLQSGVSGAGKTWTYTIRGGGGSTDLVVAIAGDVDTTGNDVAHTYTCIAYDDLCIMAVPTNAPASISVHWGLVCFIAPAVAVEGGAQYIKMGFTGLLVIRG